MQGRQHVHGKFHILPLESKCLEIKNISCNRYKPKRMNTRQNTEVSNSAKATCRLIAESKNLLQHALFLKSRFSQCFRERKKIKLNLCSFKSTWASFPLVNKNLRLKKCAEPACCKKNSSKSLTSKQYLSFALIAVSHRLRKIYPLVACVASV